MFYREKLSHHLSVGSLSQSHVCFSRDVDQVNKTGVKYVTDLLRQQSALVSKLITKQSAIVYVCGDAKNMAKDVNDAIRNILRSENGKF